MPYPPRYYGENDLHYLTTSTYRRAEIFNSELFKREFVATLAELRAELGFRLLGYVLMPEHFHMNIWSEKKQLEKLDYMHNNPVERKLVGSPGDWPWSSWRYYFLEDASIITMDRMP